MPGTRRMSENTSDIVRKNIDILSARHMSEVMQIECQIDLQALHQSVTGRRPEGEEALYPLLFLWYGRRNVTSMCGPIREMFFFPATQRFFWSLSQRQVPVVVVMADTGSLGLPDTSSDEPMAIRLRNVCALGGHRVQTGMAVKQLHFWVLPDMICI